MAHRFVYQPLTTIQSLWLQSMAFGSGANCRGYVYNTLEQLVSPVPMPPSNDHRRTDGLFMVKVMLGVMLISGQCVGLSQTCLAAKFNRFLTSLRLLSPFSANCSTLTGDEARPLPPPHSEKQTAAKAMANSHAPTLRLR